MTGPQWSRLLASVESRRPQFNDLLLKATEMVKKFFLCPASTPAVEFSTLPVQLSFPQTNSVSVPTPDLSPPSADLYQSNATAVADERTHQYSPIPPEALASNLQLPADGTNAEPVGLVANTSIMNLDLGNRKQAGSVLALEESTFHDDLLSPDWLRRDGANAVLPSPDWSFGFGFSTS